MTIGLNSYTQSIAINVNTYFYGVGGTGPYSYNVLPGGAGGTINASTGLYTAPSVKGQDNVQVTDSLGAQSTLVIAIRTPLELFCDVIQQGLGLSQGQVYLYNQKYNIPNDSRLYIAVGVTTPKPFGNTRKFDGTTGNSVQSANFHTLLQVNALSRDEEALDRKEEILLALNSQYAETQQELNSFRIFPLTQTFVNLSQEEGSAMLYRFNLGVNVQYFVTKTTPVNYYTSLQGPTVTTQS